MTRAQQYRSEGRCARCGEFSYPYYLCKPHRYEQNIRRCLENFVKRGWCDVSRDPLDNKKLYKWNNTASPKMRKHSPESIAKMMLPRLNGKPMTQDLIEGIILDVLKENNCALTEKEIERGIRSLKTIGKIVPEKDQLISEYKLIQQKKSNLSKNERNAVEIKINFLLTKNAITKEQLSWI